MLYVETSLNGPDRSDARERLQRELFASFGVTPREVVMSDPGSLPRTASHKIHRHLLKESYQA